MSALAWVGTVAATIVALAGVIKAWPTVWGFLCLPGRIEERLQKLDQLDEIKAAADEASGEWQGATAAVNRLVDRVQVADDHEHRISELERWRKFMDGL